MTTTRAGLTADNKKLLHEIEERAALLVFAVAGSAAEADRIEPIVHCAEALHHDILTLMELTNTEV